MLGERWLKDWCSQMVDYVPEIGVFLGQQTDRAVSRLWEEGKNAAYMIEAHYIV